MDAINYYQRLTYLLELIRAGSLGSPKQAAEKFNCTEKTIRNMISKLRETGNNIEYCRASGRYVLIV